MADGHDRDNVQPEEVLFDKHLLELPDLLQCFPMCMGDAIVHTESSSIPKF